MNKIHKRGKRLKTTYWNKYYEGHKTAPCHWCKKLVSFDDMTIDHEPPLADGGHKWKFVLACYECNNKRGIIFRDYLIIKETVNILVEKFWEQAKIDQKDYNFSLKTCFEIVVFMTCNKYRKIPEIEKLLNKIRQINNLKNVELKTEYQKKIVRYILEGRLAHN